MQTGTIETTLTQKVDPLLTELGDVFDDPVANQTAREMVFAALKAVNGNTTTALHSIQDISGPLKGVSLRGVVSIVQIAETIRCAFIDYLILNFFDEIPKRSDIICSVNSTLYLSILKYVIVYFNFALY